jgi:hypothetical protein
LRPTVKLSPFYLPVFSGNWPFFQLVLRLKTAFKQRCDDIIYPKDASILKNLYLPKGEIAYKKLDEANAKASNALSRSYLKKMGATYRGHRFLYLYKESNYPISGCFA